MITPPEPARTVRRRQQRVDLRAGEESDEFAVEPLLRERQDALDEGAVGRLARGREAEEGADGS